MSHRALKHLLVAVNAVLLTALVLASWDLPKAHAQAAPLASNYIMVSAVIQQDHDALVVLDLSTRLMHVFEVDRTTRKFLRRDMRDLNQDFRRGGR